MDRSGIIIERDYTDHVPMEYDKSAMSVGMGGGNSTVGMEGFLYQHLENNTEELETAIDDELLAGTMVEESKQTTIDWEQVLNMYALPESPTESTVTEVSNLDDKYSFVVNRAEFRNKVRMKWYGCLLDLVRQDAKTSYANLFKFFKMASTKGFLAKHQGCVVYIRSDGCPKQYKCAAAARMMGILGMIFGVEIDWLINAPHHGKCLVDAIAGRDKYELCNAMIRGMDSAHRDEFFKLLSEAAKAAKFLNERHATMDVKHNAVTKDKLALTERTYVVSNSEHNSVPYSKCCYHITKSQFNKEHCNYTPDGKGIGAAYSTKVGHKEMYHFSTHYRMPIGWIAMRRVPCLCNHCHQQLSRIWMHGRELRDQPMFKSVANCGMRPVMGTLNDWNFVCAKKTQLTYKSILHQVEENVAFRDGLADRLMLVESALVGAKFGIISCSVHTTEAPEGLRLVAWVGSSKIIEEPTEFDVCGIVTEPEGTVTHECFLWDQMIKKDGWFEPPKTHMRKWPKKWPVPIRCIIAANVTTTLNDGRMSENTVRADNKSRLEMSRMVDLATWRDAMIERHVRTEMMTVYKPGESITREEVKAELDDVEMEETESQKRIKRILTLTAAANPTKPSNCAVERMKLSEEKKETARIRDNKRKAKEKGKGKRQKKRRH